MLIITACWFFLRVVLTLALGAGRHRFYLFYRLARAVLELLLCEGALVKFTNVAAVGAWVLDATRVAAIALRSFVGEIEPLDDERLLSERVGVLIVEAIFGELRLVCSLDTLARIDQVDRQLHLCLINSDLFFVCERASAHIHDVRTFIG